MENLNFQAEKTDKALVYHGFNIFTVVPYEEIFQKLKDSMYHLQGLSFGGGKDFQFSCFWEGLNLRIFISSGNSQGKKTIKILASSLKDFESFISGMQLLFYENLVLDENSNLKLEPSLILKDLFQALAIVFCKKE